MTNRYIQVFVLIIVTIFYHRLFAENVRFKQLTIKEGLSQSRISSIVQDSKGFIWIGTEDGLNRYDGYDVEIFSYNPEDTLSISNQVINSLAVDDSGNVWIGSGFGGLNRYNSNDESFISYRFDPNNPNSITGGNIMSISRDAKGNLWLSSNQGGFDYFDVNRGTFTHYRHDPNDSNSLRDDRTIFIHNDSRNTVWISTERGLDRYYPATGKFRHYTVLSDGIRMAEDIIFSCVYENRDGIIYFGTFGDGIYRFDARTEQFTNIKLESPDPRNASNLVSAIIEDRAGYLWVGTWGDGLYKADKMGKPLARHVNRPSDLTSLSHNFITKIYEDATGKSGSEPI